MYIKKTDLTLISLLKIYENETGNRLDIIGYPSGEELLKDMSKIFNILILDVEMKQKTGIDVAREIRKTDDNIIIIFVASHEKYAINAYDVEALGYLIKPVQYVRLKKILLKLICMIDLFLGKASTNERYIDIKVKYETIKIEIDKIIYIEKNRNVSIVHTVHGEYTCYDTLINIYNKLDISKFVYIHQGYIVNFSVIQDIGDTTVTLIHYIKVPISRRYHKSTKERFMNNKYSLGVISQKQSI